MDYLDLIYGYRIRATSIIGHDLITINYVVDHLPVTVSPGV